MHVGEGLVQLPSFVQVVFSDPFRLYPGKQANLIVFAILYMSTSIKPFSGFCIESQNMADQIKYVCKNLHKTNKDKTRKVFEKKHSCVYMKQ